MAICAELNGLALCAGIGGLELGVKLACPEYRTVAYVEGEAYAASVLVARMADKALDEAPVWDDLGTFDGKPWRGVVDIVTSGFPCQPFSVAGKRQHEADERHLWPEIARIVGECQPAFVFLENVSLRAFVGPWRDLRGLGFRLSCPFACTAAELGAPIIRRRIFALAVSRGLRVQSWRRGWEGRTEEAVATSHWRHEPDVPRGANGIPDRVDRDRALGSAVVPQQAAFAFSSLWREMMP